MFNKVERVLGARGSRRRRALSVVAVAAVLVLLAVGARLFGTGSVTLVLLAVAVVVLLAYLDSVHAQIADLRRELIGSRKKLTTELENTYRQVESLLSLSASIHVRRPLPPTRGWAISPDFGVLLASAVKDRRPLNVLECGSGVSTLITAYCLESLGAGRVTSLEHDEKFARQTQDEIELHGLGDVARVVHTPLKEHAIGGERFLWYDLDAVPDLGTIDLLVVDGPPQSTQLLARYPAIPLLVDRLAKDALVLLDDGKRRDESAIVERWRREFEGLTAEFLETEKGAYAVSFTDSVR
jgi:predicted O-methyltransferase YrrM